MNNKTKRPNREPSYWEVNDYTDEQLGKLTMAAREFRVTGFPQKAQILEGQMQDGTPFEEIDMPESPGDWKKRKLIRPETQVDPTLLEIPPRQGKGSGQRAWQEFALLVSDIDEEVVDQFTRDEIVEVLEARDIIDSKGDDE